MTYSNFPFILLSCDRSEFCTDVFFLARAKTFSIAGAFHTASGETSLCHSTSYQMSVILCALIFHRYTSNMTVSAAFWFSRRKCCFYSCPSEMVALVRMTVQYCAHLPGSKPDLNPLGLTSE